MGLIKDFKVDNKTNLPYDCGIDLKVPVENWNIGNHLMDFCPVTYAPEGETLPDIVELFAENHEIWQATFFEAWEKLQVNGYSKTDLTELHPMDIFKPKKESRFAEILGNVA